MNRLRELFNKHDIIVYMMMSFILAFFTILISSSAASFLYRFQPTLDYVNDQSMFYYMGRMFVSGKTPYLEVFDHKGLYLFYYAGFAYLLGGRVGFFILQVIFMCFTYTFMFMTLKKLKTQKLLKIAAILVFFALYSFSMQSPGDAEPQLPLLTLMFYFYARGLLRKEDKSFLIGNIFAGICAGIAINIRASDAAVPLAFTIAYFVYAIRSKKVEQLFINIGVCVSALFLACLPPLIHSLAGGFAKEMYDAILFDNFRYVGSNNSEPTLILASRLIILALIVAYFSLLILNRKKMVQYEFITFIIMGAVMFVVQLAIAHFAHYLLIMMPFYLIALARFISLFEIQSKKVTYPVGISLIVVALASMVTFPTYYYTKQYAIDKEIVEFINETIPKEDKDNGHVLCVDCGSAMYDNCDIVIGYGDFNCQANHVKISSLYTKEKLIDYLKSGECHYAITWKDWDQDSSSNPGWFSTEEGQAYYTKIPGNHIDIFKLNV